MKTFYPWSRQEKVHFCVTDGQQWVFALLRRDSSSGGWATSVSHSHDIEFQDIDWADYDPLREGIPRAPLVMEFLLQWVSVEDKMRSLTHLLPD